MADSKQEAIEISSKMLYDIFDNGKIQVKSIDHEVNAPKQFLTEQALNQDGFEVLMIHLAHIMAGMIDYYKTDLNGPESVENILIDIFSVITKAQPE